MCLPCQPCANERGEFWPQCPVHDPTQKHGHPLAHGSNRADPRAFCVIQGHVHIMSFHVGCHIGRHVS